MERKYDELGTRMKEYEAAFRYKLIRRSYTIIRIDGKAFHTYTKGLKRPFDLDLIEDMDETAKFVCANIQGAVCAFVQSDEISVVITDFKTPKTSAWFDNTVQKMCSVSASLATAKFNNLRFIRNLGAIDEYVANKLAMFDSRVYQLPNKTEVINYFIWRQQDTVKNSISSVAQSMFSTKELHNKNGNEKQEMIFQKSGINWNDYDPKLKRGRMIINESYEKEPNVIRNRWVSIGPPTFTQDKDLLNNLIPTRD